jgi:hypothetical protein
MRRRLLIALLCAVLLVVQPTTSGAQVPEDALEPFIGKYTDTFGGERFNVYITPKSALIATWYFGSGCHVSPYPCDPPNAPIGNLPGGKATAVLWRAEDGTLIGDVLSTDQGEFFPGEAVQIRLLVNRGIELRVGEKGWVLDRVR